MIQEPFKQKSEERIIFTYLINTPPESWGDNELNGFEEYLLYIRTTNKFNIQFVIAKNEEHKLKPIMIYTRETNKMEIKHEYNETKGTGTLLHNIEAFYEKTIPITVYIQKEENKNEYLKRKSRPIDYINYQMQLLLAEMEEE